MKFTGYRHIANKSFWVHFDHDRIRAPKYQNIFQLMISCFYLIIYTIAINTGRMVSGNLNACTHLLTTF